MMFSKKVYLIMYFNVFYVGKVLILFLSDIVGSD